jgi:hypothetical protein
MKGLIPLGNRYFELHDDCQGGVRMHFQYLARGDLR